MRTIIVSILLSVMCIGGVSAQATLNRAKALYKEGNYKEALPLFESEYNLKPTNVTVGHWYAVCLYETGGDVDKAEQLLLEASRKKVRESFIYLGRLYTDQYRFSSAEEMFDQYEKLLKKKGDEEFRSRLEVYRSEASRMNRIVSHTEDIRIIDSLVVDENQFLSAYRMSESSGKLDYFGNVFSANRYVPSTVYFNEKATKIYYSKKENETDGFTLFSMDKLMDEYKNEKPLSPNNFGLKGDVNYPFIMTDGVTIYFAAKDENGMGGYDLFVSRYNMNNDTYLNPEKLNMPFNSDANDYMMVIDEEKGIGWFASDRFQPQGKVCVYTFIPNEIVRVVSSDDEKYLADRSQIRSIKSSWRVGEDYSQLIATARQGIVKERKQKKDFDFVISDDVVYHSLANFKNQASRDAYKQVIQLQKELETLSLQLEQNRERYSKSSDQDKLRMAPSILNDEKRVDYLRIEIPKQEIKVRSLEVYSSRL